MCHRCRLCYKDKVGVAGSTTSTTNKHGNAPMHAQQEMYTHGDPEHGDQSQHMIHAPSTHPHNHAPGGSRHGRAGLDMHACMPQCDRLRLDSNARAGQGGGLL